MNRKSKISVFLSVLAVLFVLFWVCLHILFRNTEQHFTSTSKIITSQIENLIANNENEKNQLQDSLKEEYISRAKALAYILENKPELQENYDELCRLAELLSIDEIDIFSPEGIITYSTVPSYVGYSMYNEGQISFFLPMLEDRSLSLCQDMVPNSAEAKLCMYAMTWRGDGDSLVEIGITPSRLLAAMEEKNISKVLDEMPLDDSLYFIYDAEQDRIVSSTVKWLYNLSDEEIPFDLKSFTDTPEKITVDDTSYVYTLTQYGNYAIGVCEAEEHLYRDSKANALILLGSLAVVLFGIALMIEFMTKRSKEKEMQYVAELENYTTQLSNYKKAVLTDALISLEANLTQNELYYGVWKDDAGNEVPLTDILGFDVPCSYDRYITSWMQRFVKTNANSSFSNKTDRNQLIDAFNEGKAEITFDYEAKTISDRSTWLRRSICMTRNQSGDVIAYTSVKDISALVAQNKREEAYVRALATEYDSIAVVELMPDNHDDHVILHGRIAGEIIRFISTEILNEVNFSRKLEMLREFVHPDDKARFTEMVRRDHILQTISEGKTPVVDFRLMTSDSSSLYYQMRFVPLNDDSGRTIEFIVCLRNIDEEIRKEFGIRQELENARIAAEAANRSKSIFLFNMSHDIRTPMNAIIGFTDIAEKHIDEKERVKDCLGKVKMSGEHLLSLINDVLDMSRVESGQVKIEEEPLFIDTLMGNLFSLLAESAKTKDIVLTSTLGASFAHRWIYADRLHIMRVLTNIVSNSVKYTNPGGKIDILVEEFPCEKEGFTHYRYTVADTGIGMSAEFLAHVFEPFSREHSATKSGVIGTGLGMSITKSLVDLMGGTISIDSKVGVGTTVWLEFDHRIAEAVDSEAADSTADSIDLSGKRILLVEDNELNREIATEILEEAGVIIDTAEDGDIAVEKMRSAKQGQYDAILMDIQMPRMNGYDATRAIRDLLNPYATSVPIIAMTANAFDEDKQNAFAAGMNGHIAKPINVPQLLAMLTDVLK